MQITIAQGGTKHQLSVDEAETIRAVKARLAPLCELPAEQQKLLHKGKEAPDGSSMVSLGIADGTRLMLLKNAQGHKAAAASPAAAAPLPASARALDAAVAAPTANAPAHGSGSIELMVTHGKGRYTVRCEPETTVIELKRLIQPLCEAAPAQQRLLIKGRQVSERGATLSALGLAAGGKVMLLFGEAHHIQAEHASAVSDAATEVPRLTERLAALQRQQAKRLIDSAEVLASVASLDEQVGALTQDMKNAGMHGPCGTAEEARVARLSELEALSDEVAQLREQLFRP